MTTTPTTPAVVPANLLPRWWSPVATLLLVLAACQAPPAGSALLHTVAWVQSAAEREAACIQVFAAATAAMRERTGLADLEARPLAVVVDVDETMLDNSSYQASLVRDDARFREDSWQRWCEQASATAIPGAVEFALACQARGVTVFYVTNRDVAVEAATRRNLSACGFPLDDGDGVDVVLSLGEPAVDGRPQHDRSKTRRRAVVAAGHDVLLFVGDDLNDFVDAEATIGQRRLQVRAHAADWGVHWFVVPNPMYGSWESAITRGAADPTAAKREVLSPAR